MMMLSLESNILELNDFSPMSISTQNRKLKTFSGGIEKEHWGKMGQF